MESIFSNQEWVPLDDETSIQFLIIIFTVPTLDFLPCVRYTYCISLYLIPTPRESGQGSQRVWCRDCMRSGSRMCLQYLSGREWSYPTIVAGVLSMRWKTGRITAFGVMEKKKDCRVYYRRMYNQSQSAVGLQTSGGL